jgi:hypothetical protein
MLMIRILYALTAHLPCRLVPLPSGPYLERYFICQLPCGAQAMLHRIVRPDSERLTHNHPWRTGVSFVLAGWYLERRLLANSATTRFVRWFNRVDGDDYHRIVNARAETWTLFLRGPSAKNPDGTLKGWGFLDEGTYVPFPSAPSRWWEKAPKGKDAGREPMGGQA